MLTPFLKRPIGFTEAVSEVGVKETAGRLVLPRPQPIDAWSDIVSDLRGAYAGVAMPKYGQGRIHIGSAFLTFAASAFIALLPHQPFYVRWMRGDRHRDFPPFNIESVADRPPPIPIIVVTLSGEQETFARLKERSDKNPLQFGQRMRAFPL
ncbi:hypothetical protein ASG35_11750 [Burkholderia sp. Leaf177]|nr:hypothetical protein ASG35_11750 [Burkholderia sp. Leaf177]